MTTPLIEFKDICKSFGDRTILSGVNFTIEEGDITTIIGKSGVGKSVTIKHIVGLLKPDSGELLYKGKPLSAMSRADRKTFRSRVSYMFQHNALFDSMTVFDNIALPLREKTRLKKAEIEKRVMDKMHALELSEVPDRYPSQLSGGMQKRVALARALITEPSLVLFDEPTTGLDPIRKNSVLSMVAHYKKLFGFTAILVSHDIPDVFYISDRVIIIEEGKTLFQGDPFELEHSRHEVVQEFIGSLDSLKNDLAGTVSSQAASPVAPSSSGAFTTMAFQVEDLPRFRKIAGDIALHKLMETLVQSLCTRNGQQIVPLRIDDGTLFATLPEANGQQAETLLGYISEDIAASQAAKRIRELSGGTAWTIRTGAGTGKAGADATTLVQEVLASAEAGIVI